MIARERVAAGVLRYVDCEVCPHVPGFKSVALAAVAALYAQKIPVIFDRLQAHPAVAILDVISADGMVDVDALYNAFAPKISQPVQLNVPFIGQISIDRAEIDKMYRYIKEA